jgi:hypothetical protein
VISEALTFLVAEVNRYLDAQLGSTTADRVVLGNIARLADDSGGGGGKTGDGSLAMLTLVNIEEDKASRNPQHFRRIDDQIIYRNPSIQLNLYGLFSAHTATYSTALEIVAYIIQCFQAQKTFESQSDPNLDPQIGKLTVDLFSLNFEQINHLWSTLGGKYYPSALYKIRLVIIEDTTPMAGGGLIREIDLNGRGKPVE